MTFRLSQFPTGTAGDETSGAEGPASAVDPRLDRWCLTLLFHPDPARIGAQFGWAATPGLEVQISRLAPAFELAGAGPARPLEHARVSRSALRILNLEHGLELLADDARVRFEVEGRPGADRISLSTSQLQKGVTITLGRRVSFMLHPDPGGSAEQVGDDLGLSGVSPALRRVRDEVRRVAELDVPVLLCGESGVGKELVAQALHRLSPRSSRPFVPVNMSALDPSTALAELFGHDRGAFTGAMTRRPGLFGQAEGGTLFLDEIGETSSEIQPMLLRALESREIRPLGLPARPVNVRILAATDADLAGLTGAGQFRHALLHRLSVITIAVPPLRDRRMDIPFLLIRLLREALRQVNAERLLEAPAEGEPGWLRRSDVLTLLRYPWPGNVRELRNVAFQMALEAHARPSSALPGWLLERLTRLDAGIPFATRPPTRSSGENPPNHAGHQAPGAGSAPLGGSGCALHGSIPGWRPARVDAATLRNTLEERGWRIGETAAALGISRKSLYAWMQDAGIVHAGNLSREAILEAARQEGSTELERVAARLTVSARGLKLRLRQLELEL